MLIQTTLTSMLTWLPSNGQIQILQNIYIFSDLSKVKPFLGGKLSLSLMWCSFGAVGPLDWQSWCVLLKLVVRGAGSLSQLQLCGKIESLHNPLESLSVSLHCRSRPSSFFNWRIRTASHTTRDLVSRCQLEKKVTSVSLMSSRSFSE